MKIAVSACGIHLDSPIDPRFGRCDYFVIVDTSDMSFEVFENGNAALSQGAGIQSARFVISKGARAVITGDIGPNAVRALSGVGVDVAIRREGTVREAVDDYRAGTLKLTHRASVEDHHGFVGQAARDRIKSARTEPEKQKDEDKVG